MSSPRFSIVWGRWWLRFRYPDSGLWRFGTYSWVFRERPQKRTEWRKWVLTLPYPRAMLPSP